MTISELYNSVAYNLKTGRITKDEAKALILMINKKAGL